MRRLRGGLPTGALTYAARAEHLRAQLAEAQRRGRGEVTVTCRPAAGGRRPPASAADDATPGQRRGQRPRGDDPLGVPDPATVVVACLGGLSVADLIAAAATGCTTLRLANADCETCRDRVAGEAVQAAVVLATATLAALGSDLR